LENSIPTKNVLAKSLNEESKEGSVHETIPSWQELLNPVSPQRCGF